MSLFPADEELPTWLHTALLLLVVLPFALPLAWLGIEAVATGHLEPVSGPEFGQYFFGRVTLHGLPARLGGVSLIVLAAAFLAIAFRFSRFADGDGWRRILPWALLAVSIALSWLVKAVK